MIQITVGYVAYVHKKMGIIGAVNENDIIDVFSR